MIETKQKEIGGAVYSVTQLPARRALKLKAKLIKMFGPSVSHILMTATEPQEKPVKEMNEEELVHHNAISPVDHYRIMELRKNSLVKGIQLLAQDLDEKVFDQLCVEMLQCVRRDNVELVESIIDTVFAGNLMELYLVIAFVLEVNYADFFLAMKNTGGQFEEETTQETQSQKKTYTFPSNKNS